MKVKLALIVNPEFVNGFLKLCRLPLANFKDTYALAKTLRQLREEAKTYEVARMTATEKHKVGDGMENAKDPHAYKAFTDDLLVVLNTDVDLFLDHKVEVPLGIQQADPFTATEISALEDSGLVEFK